jgi:hypothetical protein
MIIVLRLIDKYSPQYGEQTAAALASAVTNELFGVPPGNDVGRQFLSSNKALIDAQLRAVKGENRICQIVSVLAHTKFNIAGQTGTVTPEMIMWVAKLRDLGILLPADQIDLPSSRDEMRQQVREFELWSLQSK